VVLFKDSLFCHDIAKTWLPMAILASVWLKIKKSLSESRNPNNV
jgi:hypothetical protein